MLPPRWEEDMPYKSWENNKGYIFTGKCTSDKWMSLISCFCLKIIEEICFKQSSLSRDGGVLFQVITENYSSSLYALQAYDVTVHAWPVF